jgi:hypothetical protein
VRWYRKAAEQGNADAQYNLGASCHQGKGTPQDHAEAVKWYRKAAEQGNASSQYNLGGMYLLGHFVPQDYAASAMWFRKAAEQGHWMAQFHLGMAHFYGHGVPKDYSRAYFWIAVSTTGCTGERCFDTATAQDEISLMLTPEQLQKTEQMILEWETKHLRK